VAVTVALVFTFTAGAVKRPVLLTLPSEADQRTDTLPVLDTLEPNCTTPEETTVVFAGEMETTIAEVRLPVLNPTQARDRIVRQTIANASVTATLRLIFPHF
jgi:hypothetical protein